MKIFYPVFCDWSSLLWLVRWPSLGHPIVQVINRSRRVCLRWRTTSRQTLYNVFTSGHFNTL